MKVLIVNSVYHPIALGGSERSTQMLAESLLEKGIIPVVVTVSKEDRVDYVNGVKVYYIKASNIYHFLDSKMQNPIVKIIWKIRDLYSLKGKRTFKNIIEEEKPNLLHSNVIVDLTVSIWKVAYEKQLPIVHTIRDYYLMCHRSSMFNREPCKRSCLKCRTYSYLKRLNAKYVTAVIGVSNDILTRHVSNKYFSNARIKRTIYNPVYKPQIKERKDSIYHVGYVGKIAEYKGVEVLLKTFFYNYKDHDGLVLDVYGKPEKFEYGEELKDKYKASNIIFHGQKPQAEVFNNIDVLVVPSLWPEPFGRIVPESYSYGVPVIVNDYGGLSELVVDGVTGYKIKINSPDLLLTLAYFIDNKPDMKIACLWHSNKYSVSSIAIEYINLYKEVLEI